MPLLEPLTLSSLEIKNLQMQADGYCIWLVWPGELNPIVDKTLEDSGGVRIGNTENQALWFFFSNDVCVIAGHIASWARFNPASIAIEIFPAKMIVDGNGQKKVEVDQAIQKQNIQDITEFQIWVHPDIVAIAEGTLGLSFSKGKPLLEGMSSTNWFSMQTGARLPQDQTMGWFVVLRPVGMPSDKKFQLGWHDFLQHLEDLLQRNKFRYTIKDYFLMLPLDGGLNRLRAWCRDFMALVERTRDATPSSYWPCVMAIIDKKNLNFSEELPEKFGLDWKQLAPDFPHMAARNAFMLGEEFVVQGVRFATNSHTPDDWCTVSFADKNKNTERNLPNLVSEMTLGNFPHCFYCGQRSHEAKDCPTKKMPQRDPETWKQMAFLDFSSMSSAVASINQTFQKKGKSALAGLYKKKNAEGLFLRALFDICWFVQLRSLGTFWRAKDKDLTSLLGKKTTDENSPAYKALEELITGTQPDLEERGKSLALLATRFPKDFRIMSLQGFDAMERGNWKKAGNYWKEAEMASPLPVVAAVHLLLQARALEIQSLFLEASQLYDHVLRQCPKWTFVMYRKIVCDIKSGFSRAMIPALIELIEKEGVYYNQVLIDPEIERGYIQIVETLNQRWLLQQDEAKKEVVNLKGLLEKLPGWFIPNNEFAKTLIDRINTLLKMATIKNYVALQTLVQGRVKIERDLQKYVKEESRALRDGFKKDYDQLEYIKEEAAWFPFPSAIKEFSKKYSESVEAYNWVMKSNLMLPAAFRTSQSLKIEQDERLNYLEKKMKFLRLTRDLTLFLLAVAELFVRIEIIGLILIFGVVPLLIAYGGDLGMGWTAQILSKEQFKVQKIFFMLLSIFALGVAVLRAFVRFDSIREKVFSKAKASAEKSYAKAKGNK